SFPRACLEPWCYPRTVFGLTFIVGAGERAGATRIMRERAGTLLGTATVVFGVLAGYAGCSASGGGPQALGGAGGGGSGGESPAPVSVGSGGSGGATCDPGSPA